MGRWSSTGAHLRASDENVKIEGGMGSSVVYNAPPPLVTRMDVFVSQKNQRAVNGVQNICNINDTAFRHAGKA